jgi:hypothetical protein
VLSCYDRIVVTGTLAVQNVRMGLKPTTATMIHRTQVGMRGKNLAPGGLPGFYGLLNQMSVSAFTIMNDRGD